MLSRVAAIELFGSISSGAAKCVAFSFELFLGCAEPGGQVISGSAEKGREISLESLGRRLVVEIEPSLSERQRYATAFAFARRASVCDPSEVLASSWAWWTL